MRLMWNQLLCVSLCLSFLSFFPACSSNKADAAKDQPEVPITADSLEKIWYKNAVIYTLDVEVFKDSDGDGIGDFRGLTEKLGFIDSLGVDAIWLAPFQPTPNKDDGYDVADYYAVDPRLGTMADFNSFIAAAKQKNLRVIMDLVLNHTSDKHPWFQQARNSPSSPFRSWYVWSKDKPKNFDKGMVFPGVQESIWSFDSTAGEYYYHRFYKFQPDLNSQNPEVQKEIRKVIQFWLEAGIAGFRLDGVPFFIEVPKKEGEEFEHQFELLTQMRAHVNSLRKDAVILGEANVLPEETKDYFGSAGNGMHMMFNFFVNQHLFYALATGRTAPLKDALKETRKIPIRSQWGQFLRNHDELDLGRLKENQRQEVFDAFGPDTTMQLYDRGIRRRLAPMLKDRRRLELAYSLLFSLPSTPVIRYGDEIGMGDNLSLKERESVRTPMQWNRNKNGGFSTADSTIHPVINDPIFGYQTVNVEEQLPDSTSFLNWKKKMIALRRESKEIGIGTWQFLETTNAELLAMRYQWENKELLVVHNFSAEPRTFEIDNEDIATGNYIDLITGSAVSTSRGDHLRLDLPAFGYRWFQNRSKLILPIHSKSKTGSSSVIFPTGQVFMKSIRAICFKLKAQKPFTLRFTLNFYHDICKAFTKPQGSHLA